MLGTGKGDTNSNSLHSQRDSGFRHIFRQVLECGNEACAVAAFDMEPSCLDVPSPRTRRRESGESLRSSPQSKTLPRSSKSRQILQQRMLFMLATVHLEHFGPLSFHGGRPTRIPIYCNLVLFRGPLPKNLRKKTKTSLHGVTNHSDEG